MTTIIKRAGTRLACAVTLGLASVSCGDMARNGQASSYLIITALQAASGTEPEEFGGNLNSDVAPVFNDLGQVEFQLAMKDPTLTGPTTANFITIDRYRVKYIRTDGRNVEGVDVPYTFDGAITGTVSESASLSFTIVRHQAKEEAPLRTLRANPFLGIILSTIAEVTFYGHDQTGRAVSVTGKISINFADFADAE
jgi:hypothetical protein